MKGVGRLLLALVLLLGTSNVRYVMGLSCAMVYTISTNSFFALNDTANNYVTTYQVQPGGTMFYTPNEGLTSPIRYLHVLATLTRLSSNDPDRVGTDPTTETLTLDAIFYNIGRRNSTCGVPMNGEAERADWFFFSPHKMNIRNAADDFVVEVKPLPLGTTTGRLLQVGTGAGTVPTDYVNTGASWDFLWRTLNPDMPNTEPTPWTNAGYLRFVIAISCDCADAFPFTSFLGNPGMPPDYALHLRPRYSRQPFKTFYYYPTLAYNQMPLIYGFNYNFYQDPREKVMRFRAFMQPVETLPATERNLLLLDIIVQGNPGNEPGTGYGAPVDANSPFLVYPYTVENGLTDAAASGTGSTEKRRKTAGVDALAGRASPLSLPSVLGRALLPSFYDMGEARGSEEGRCSPRDARPGRQLGPVDEDERLVEEEVSEEEERRRLDIVSSSLVALWQSSVQGALQAKAGRQSRRWAAAQDAKAMQAQAFIDPYTPVWQPVPRGRTYNDLPTIGPAPVFGDDIQFFRFIKGTIDDLTNNAQYDIHPLNSSIFPAPGYGADSNQLGPYMQVGTNANTLAEGYGAWFPFQFRMRRGKLWRMGNFTIIINNPVCPKK